MVSNVILSDRIVVWLNDIGSITCNRRILNLPNVKSAKKRVKTNELRRNRNRSYRSNLKTSMKKVLSSTDPERAAQYLGEAISLLDNCSCMGIIHKNNAARKKARLMAHVNSLGS